MSAVADKRTRKAIGVAQHGLPPGVIVKAVIQILFATGKSFTVDGLRDKLRDFFRGTAGPLAPALTNIELITALLDCNRQLGGLGLQLRITNGVVSLITTRVENELLAAYLREQTGTTGNPDLTPAMLEVLAFIAFKQPVSQGEIDQLFGADKRGLVVKLRDQKFVADFAGEDGRLRFATTDLFLQKFGMGSLQELNAVFTTTAAAGPKDPGFI